MVIYIKDVVNACDTNVQGDVIFRLALRSRSKWSNCYIGLFWILNVTSPLH